MEPDDQRRREEEELVWLWHDPAVRLKSSGISALRMAWDMGRQGVPVPVPPEAASLLLRLLPDEVLLLVLSLLDFRTAMLAGMTCRRLQTLWQSDSLHRVLCERRGVLMDVMYPSLRYVHARPWFECSMRAEAWLRAAALLGRLGRRLPGLFERMAVQRFPLPNPLGVIIRRGGLPRTLHTMSKEHEGTECILCDTAINEGFLYMRMTADPPPATPRHLCYGCADMMPNPSRTLPTSKQKVRQGMRCTYCRAAMEADALCVTVPYATICLGCWNSDGFHMRVTVAEKLHRLAHRDRKPLWEGRMLRDPMVPYYGGGGKTKDHPITKPMHVLGEDARGQAILKHGTAERAMQLAQDQAVRRRRDRGLKMTRIRAEMVRVLDVSDDPAWTMVVHESAADGVDKGGMAADFLRPWYTGTPWRVPLCVSDAGARGRLRKLCADMQRLECNAAEDDGIDRTIQRLGKRKRAAQGH